MIHHHAPHELIMPQQPIIPRRPIVAGDDDHV
jgi:hypothetical protein